MRWSEEEYQNFLKKNGVKTTQDKSRKPKYNNKHTWVDGICFDSQKEADYYQELKLRMLAGDIKGFCRQPSFILVEGNEKDKAITYSADFIVFNLDGTADVIDTKGMETEQWKRTYKMFRLKYPELELKVVK